MKRKFGILIFCFILSFLPFISFACNKRNSGESQSLHFYYSRGSYHVISQLDFDETIAMSVVGCTNLAKPELVVGEWKSNQTLTGQCVILYDRRDCQTPRMEAPVKFDQILNSSETHSFHLCAWKDISNSPKFPRPLKNSQVVLHHRPYYDGSLSHYSHVENCTNLKESDDKKVSSIYTYRNCVHLYELQNCQGATIKANMTVSRDLARVGWANRASSIKACGMELQAKITTFRPTSTQEDLELNRVLRKTDMETSQPFVNNGSSPIIARFETKKPITDSFWFKMIPGLNLLENAEVMDDIIVEDIEIKDYGGVVYPHICFPDDSSSTRCIAVARLKRELKQAYQFERKKGSHHTEIRREFLVGENVTIPACSSLEVESFIIMNENLLLKFELGLRISGENRGKPITSAELRSQISSSADMDYLQDLNEFEIFAKVRGSILVTVGVRAEVVVKTVEDAIPGCIITTQPTMPSSSSPEEDAADQNPSMDTGVESVDPSPSPQDNSSLVEILSKYKIHIITVIFFSVCTIARLWYLDTLGRKEINTRN